MREYRSVNQLFVYTIFFVLFISILGLTGGSENYLVSLAISQLCMLLPAVIYLSVRKHEIKSKLGLYRVSISGTVAAIVMGFAIIPFISLINSISMLFVKNVTDEKVAVAAEKYPLILMLIGLALIPALVEEFIYRGIYFNTYKKIGILQGAMIAAFLFALMHGNLNQFAYAMVAGFLFAMIDNAGGSIFYSVIIHVIINGVSVVSLYAEQFNSQIINEIAEKANYTSVSQVIKALGLPALLGLVITAIGYAVIGMSGRKRAITDAEVISDKKEKKSKVPKYNMKNRGRIIKLNDDSDKIFDAYLVTGIVIMVINLVLNEVV